MRSGTWGRRLRGLALCVTAAGCCVAALAGIARAAGFTVLVVNDESTSNSVSFIDSASNTVFTTVGVGQVPLGIAVTPDSRTAYVVDLGLSAATSAVTPINLAAPPTAQPSIDFSSNPGNFIAISPNGAKAYVTDPGDGQVVPLSLTTSPATKGAAITVGPKGTSNPEGIAFAPNGATAYATDNGANSIIPITVASDAAGTPINVGHHTFAIAITPNGATAYVTSASDGVVIPVSLGSRTVGAMIPVGANPRGIAITPDGSTAFVANGNSGSVTPIDTATNTAGAPINVGGGPYAIAVTPDGKTVYVTDGNGSTVVPITVATRAVGAPIAVGNLPRGIAITAAQGVGQPGGGGAGGGGAGPVVSFCGCSLNFGNVQVSETATRHLIITNTGNAPLRITKDTFTGQAPADFAISSDGCKNKSVAAGASCTVMIAFTPTAVGPRSATLSFTDNASASPQSVVVSGTGFQPEIFNTITLPSNRGCFSKRVIVIHIGLGRAAKLHFKLVSIYVKGKLRKILTGSNLHSTVDLRGLPKGTFVVRIDGLTTDGRTLTGKRTYHTCTKKKKHKKTKGL